MSDRIKCCVPFCGRSEKAAKLAAKGHNEWICEPHYKAVPKRLKDKRRANRRRQRPNAAGIDGWLWRECKRVAIEAAGGIG
jgi:hypothetical protein